MMPDTRAGMVKPGAPRKGVRWYITLRACERHGGDSAMTRLFMIFESSLFPCQLFELNTNVACQRIVHGDTDAPQQPRLRAVYLDLAECADAGKVSRRYLLHQSKTNATLKVCRALSIGVRNHADGAISG